MFLDINGSEFLILAVLALIVIGPQRLPEYAQQLRTLVRRGRDLLRQGQQSLTQEVGTDVDWSQYDPRQYDPRRIVREALSEEGDEVPAPAMRRAPRQQARLEPGAIAPFDPEST